MANFYVVTGGRCSGIFTSRDRVLDAIVGFPGAKCRKFSTLKEAEEAMKKQRGKGKTPIKWTGDAYAVAVGRRMGIFTHQEALNQTRYYSANSLKRFDSYEEAVEFLDTHNWRKMPNSVLNDVKLVKMEDSWATESNATTDTGSKDSSTADNRPEIDSSASNEAGSDENTMLAVISPKRKRDDIEDVEGQGQTRRQRVDNTTSETLYAFCNGCAVHSGEEEESVMMLCTFPNHSEWDVQQIVMSEGITLLQAGLLAVEEALKRANREDPERTADLTIFTVRWQLFDALNEQDREEDETRHFLQNIMAEKGIRKIKVCRLHGGFELNPRPRNTDNA